MTWAFAGAGDGCRTRVTSLEGWSSTVELHPQMGETVAVGEGGFEPPASCPQSRRATKLRHSPANRLTGTDGMRRPDPRSSGTASGFYTWAMALAMPAGGRLTYEDLQRFPDDGRRYELMDGTLVVTPAPGVPHQVVVGALYRILFAARPIGTTVLLAPVDFVPDPATVLEPDVLVVDAEEIDQARVTRTPHLVIEVLSPSTRAQDLGSKLLAYAAAGVPAYWIIDPERPMTLQAFHLEEAEYHLVARVASEERFEAVDPFPVTIVPEALLEV